MGRFRAARLMKECNLESPQLPKHRYKKTGEEAEIAPNILYRQFDVDQTGQVLVR